MQRLFKDLFTVEEPAIFLPLNDVELNTEYRFNITPAEKMIADDKIISGYSYDALVVPYPLNANNILKTMLAEMYPEDQELKLQNDFNAAALGIELIDKQQRYVEYLNIRKALREMIDTQCGSHNISLV